LKIDQVKYKDRIYSTYDFFLTCQPHVITVFLTCQPHVITVLRCSHSINIMKEISF